jgi:hypothetical protein
VEADPSTAARAHRRAVTWINWAVDPTPCALRATFRSVLVLFSLLACAYGDTVSADALFEDGLDRVVVA